tara:strand:+ start:253 stop:1899 length:1647 start_codon:yes stop_codon:yes gene_type:complete
MVLTRDDISLLSGIVATNTYQSLDNFAAAIQPFINFYGLEINDFVEVATLNLSQTREVYSTAVISLVPAPGSTAEPIIFVAARGSTNLVNWSDNLDIFQAQAMFPFADPSLPIEGSKTFIQWNSFANFDWDPEGQPGTVCEQNGIRDILECKFQDPTFANAAIVCTGHSAGAFTAGFHAASAAHEFPGHQVILTTFGSPKTGNKSYNEVISKSIIEMSGGWIRQYVTPNDVVPLLTLYDVFAMDEIRAPRFVVTIGNTQEIIDDFEIVTIGGLNQFLYTIGNFLKADPNYYLGVQEGLNDISILSFAKYLTGHQACVYNEAMLREYWPQGGNVAPGDEDKFLALCSYNGLIGSANSYIKETSLAYQKNMAIWCDVVKNPCNNIWYNEGVCVLKDMVCNYKCNKKKNIKQLKKSVKLFADTFWSDGAACLEIKPGLCNVLNSCNPLKQEQCKYSCCCNKKNCKKVLEKVAKENETCKKHKNKDCSKCKKFICNPQVPCKACKECEDAQTQEQVAIQAEAKAQKLKAQGKVAPPVIESKYKKKYGRVRIV